MDWNNIWHSIIFIWGVKMALDIFELFRVFEELDIRGKRNENNNGIY